MIIKEKPKKKPPRKALPVYLVFRDSFLELQKQRKQMLKQVKTCPSDSIFSWSGTNNPDNHDQGHLPTSPDMWVWSRLLLDFRCCSVTSVHGFKIRNIHVLIKGNRCSMHHLVLVSYSLAVEKLMMTLPFLLVQ